MAAQGHPAIPAAAELPPIDPDLYRVLLVEDNRGDSVLIGEALRDSGGVLFSVDRASTLAEARTRLSESAYDAILLDLGLPDSQGFETLTAMLGSTKAPVLVLTGLDDETIGVQSVRHGAQDFLVKGRTSEEVLRRSLRYAVERARLREATSSPLIETAPVGLAVLDRDRRYLYVNPALAELNGLPALAHLGRRIGQVSSLLGMDAVDLLDRVIETGQPAKEVEVTGQAAGQQGTTTLLLSAEPLQDASGASVGLALSLVDISERKRKEEALAALAESRSQAQVIGETIAYGIWVCEPDGGLRYASPSFLELIGMTIDEARGFGWTQAVTGEPPEAVQQAWQLGFSRGGQWEREVSVNGTDGRSHTILSRGHPVIDESGRVSSWAGINLDITRRKEAEAFREAFIGVLSHELRTPVTSIAAAATLLRRSTAEGSPGEDLVADISSEAEHLHRLIEDLLVLAQAERGSLQVETEPVLLPHVVARAVANERRIVGDRTLELSISPNIPVACGDETLLGQVLISLLTNAVKFGPPEGCIHLIVDQVDGSPRLRVLDEGPGVDPAESELLFDLFYRSQRTALVNGSGIGLFVARRLVEAMGGTISARPRDDGPGAEFTVVLSPFRED
jgi:PAS domain S-box-containing protein